MSNKAISAQFFEIYAGRHDLEGCAGLFHPDAIIETTVAPGLLSFEAYRHLGLAFLCGFPDIACTILRQYEAGDTVITHVVWSGTHTGPLHGLPPTGRTFSSQSMIIDRFEGGKIKHRLEVADTLAMLMHLGLTPAQAV